MTEHNARLPFVKRGVWLCGDTAAAAAANLSPTNSILRILGGGGGRNWPSVVKDRRVRLLPERQRERRDSGGGMEGEQD